MTTKSLKVTKLAAELTKVRADLAEAKEQVIAPLEQAEEDLREQLFNELKATGMDTLRYEGNTFVRQSKVSFKIVDEEMAMKFAEQYPSVLKVDLTKATKIIKPMLSLPAGFERQDTEFLSVRKSNDGEERDVE